MKQFICMVVLLINILPFPGFAETGYDFFSTHRQTDEWLSSFSVSLQEKLANQHLSEQAMLVIRQALKNEKPPADPGLAAQMTCDALLFCEIALRKAAVPHEIKNEIRNAWRVSQSDGNRFRSRLINRLDEMDRSRPPQKGPPGKKKPR